MNTTITNNRIDYYLFACHALSIETIARHYGQSAGVAFFATKCKREWGGTGTADHGGLVVGSAHKKAALYMKQKGVFAGKPFVDAVFNISGCRITWESIAVEGNFYVKPGEKLVLATVEGPTNLFGNEPSSYTS